MSVKLNTAAKSHAASLIAAGKYTTKKGWSKDSAPERSEENKEWFLGIDTDAAEDTEARYKYPYGDGEKVHRAALIAIETRGGANAPQIAAAAKALLAEIDKKGEDNAYHSDYEDSERYITVNGANGIYADAIAQIVDNQSEDGIITAYISTSFLNRRGDIMIPSGVKLRDFYKNPRTLWMHNDMIPDVANVRGDIDIRKDGLVAKTFFPRRTDESKILYEAYKSGDMNAFSVGFTGVEWEDVDKKPSATYPLGRERTYTNWILDHNSLVSIGMDANALTINSMGTMNPMEPIVRNALTKGIIDVGSSAIRSFGLSTRIITTNNLSDTTMSKTENAMSGKDAKELALHTHKIAGGIVKAKNGMEMHGGCNALHTKGEELMRNALDLHEEALKADGDEQDKKLMEAHNAFRAVHAHMQAHGLVHHNAHETAKDGHEEIVDGYNGLKEHMNGYPDAFKETDETKLASVPFKDEQPTGGGESGDVSNIVKTHVAELSNSIKGISETQQTTAQTLLTVVNALESAGIIKKPTPEDVAKKQREDWVKSQLGAN